MRRKRRSPSATSSAERFRYCPWKDGQRPVVRNLAQFDALRDRFGTERAPNREIAQKESHRMG